MNLYKAVNFILTHSKVTVACFGVLPSTQKMFGKNSV